MLAVRVQQVGQVGVQRRHPMLVSELPAELEGLGRLVRGSKSGMKSQPNG